MTDREFSDVEITMHAYRLMRDGMFRNAQHLWDALQADFPTVPKEKLRQIMADLCRKLREAQ